MSGDSEIREICRERCAEAGDPPCWRLDADNGVPFAPCSDCLADAGEPENLPLDPDAVIRNLI